MTDGQTDKQMKGARDTQGLRGRLTWTDGETDGQMDRLTDGQTEKQIER